MFFAVTILSVCASSQVTRVPVHLTRLDFASDIVPILTKAGCNSGACHGAAIGRGGFHLSLLGYDPRGDYDRIAHEFGGRRIQLGAPDDSLLLRKAGFRVRHGGGLRLEPGSAFYNAVHAWIATGARYGSEAPAAISISASPADALLPKVNASVSLRVTAAFSDGTTRDVTELALYSVSDDAIARVTSGGRATVLARGVTTIMVRFLGQVAAVRVGVPFSDAPVAETALGGTGFIDKIAGAEFAKLHLPPSPDADDSEFLRRVFLDTIGTLPGPDEVRTFLDLPPSATKRLTLVESLLKRPEFTDFWSLKLADMLLISSKRLGDEDAAVYYRWLHSQIADSIPMDQMVRSLIASKGAVRTDGAANFYRLHSDPRDMGEYVSRTFLGVRLQCARCHSHPFDRWTQTDYYSFASFFARTRFDGKSVVTLDRGEVPNPVTNRPAGPRLLGVTSKQSEGNSDRRIMLAGWLTSNENPLFAKAFVNRVWREVVGSGLVMPVDDIRATNPASNPAMLEALAQEFVHQHYDLRSLVRTIISSNLYGRTSRSNSINQRDQRFGSHAAVKPLQAQVLADAIAQVTGVPDIYPRLPEGTRAIQLIDAQTPSYTLDVFGRCKRDTDCESGTSFGGGLPQALHLINSSSLDPKIRDGVLKQLFMANRSNSSIVEEIYLRALSRYPTKQESVAWESALSRPDRRAAAEDLFWAVLNSREFTFNH